MPFLPIVVMDRSSHLSVILDLSPTQWSLSANLSNPHPLSFDTFLSHLLVFLNSHIACKHENSLAVFGALPGKRSALCFPFVLVLNPSHRPAYFFILPRRQEILHRPRSSNQTQTRIVSSKPSISLSSTASLASSTFSANRTLKVLPVIPFSFLV